MHKHSTNLTKFYAETHGPSSALVFSFEEWERGPQASQGRENAKRNRIAVATINSL